MIPSASWTITKNSRYPIYCIPQRSFTSPFFDNTIHVSESTTRYLLDIKEQEELSNINNEEFILSKTIYEQINIYADNLVSKQTCPTEELSHAFLECCGFSSIVISCTLLLLHLFCEQTQKTLLECFTATNAEYLMDKTNTDTIIFKDRELQINNFSDFIKICFKNISGYNYVEGGNVDCSYETHLDLGINLVTIMYEPFDDPTLCNTMHYFTVLNTGTYSIVYDTWAGGDGGCRLGWSRIILTLDLQNILNDLNDDDLVQKIRTQHLKNYFAAPNHYISTKSNKVYSIQSKKVTKIGIYTQTKLYELIYDLLPEPYIPTRPEKVEVGGKNKKSRKIKKSRKNKKSRKP